MKLFHWIGSWLFPEKCILCGKVLEREELDLCRSCRVDGPVWRKSGMKIPFVQSWLAVWNYEGRVRGSLLRYKFYNRRNYAAGYGRLLAMKLIGEDASDFDVLTYIPISQKRLKTRGFDQVALLAQKVSQELDMEPTVTLRKVRHNSQQSRIVGDAQRRANVLGAYEAVDPAALIGKRVLLLDDVVTTGATASECARVLLTAGAKEVQLAVIAAANHK